MKKCYALLLLLSPALAYGFQEKPWLGEVWCCEFNADFTYSRYHEVEGAVKQLRSPSNDKVETFDLSLIPSSCLDVQFELEFADTLRESFGLRSSAIQGRYLWMNDVAGDPFSWTTGLSVRKATRRSLKDVSTPYHSEVNIELNSAFGKEWCQQAFWTTHLWGLVGVGIANHGSPWLRALAVYEKNWNDRHRLGFFSEGFFGFGKKEHVDINHFDGWGKFHHQSVDVGVLYRYHTDTWGEVTVAYTRRVFAHVFPQNVNFITIAYNLPFSFF